MRAAGLAVFERTLDYQSFVAALRDKLVEETAEAVAAVAREELLGELADVMEVVLTLGEAYGFTAAEIETARRVKRAERGGFDGRVWNAAVEGAEDRPTVDYYLARPEQYPQI